MPSPIVPRRNTVRDSSLSIEDNRCPSAMTLEKQDPEPHYTCNEYREEMILLALRRRLQQPDLEGEERERLIGEIARLEKAIGF